MVDRQSSRTRLRRSSSVTRRAATRQQHEATRLSASHAGHDVGRLGEPIIVVVSCRVREASEQGLGKDIVKA